MSCKAVPSMYIFPILKVCISYFCIINLCLVKMGKKQARRNFYRPLALNCLSGISSVGNVSKEKLLVVSPVVRGLGLFTAFLWGHHGTKNRIGFDGLLTNNGNLELTIYLSQHFLKKQTNMNPAIMRMSYGVVVSLTFFHCLLFLAPFCWCAL